MISVSDKDSKYKNLCTYNIPKNSIVELQNVVSDSMACISVEHNLHHCDGCRRGRSHRRLQFPQLSSKDAFRHWNGSFGKKKSAGDVAGSNTATTNAGTTIIRELAKFQSNWSVPATEMNEPLAALWWIESLQTLFPRSF